MRKRPPTAGRGVTTRDAEEQRLIKRFRTSILKSRTRRAGGASGGMDDDDDETDDETGDELIDQYDNHRPTIAHGFSADASPDVPAGGGSPGLSVEDALNKLVNLSELQVLSRGGGGGGSDGGQFIKPADFPKGLLDKLGIHDPNTKRVLDDL